MSNETSGQEQAICDMYRNGSSLRTLELAFDRPADDIIRILAENGVVEPHEGESQQAFFERVRDDVKHAEAD